MFLVLVPTVFQGNLDTVCGDEEEWSLPWRSWESDNEIDWDYDDHPGRDGDLANENYAACIVDANYLDSHNRRE